jgi:hypothetical protein
MEYLANLNLNILNQGNKPTSVTHNREDIINLTLRMNKIGNLLTIGMNLISLLYQITGTYIFRQVTQLLLLRDPKITNWESYKDDL